MNKQFNIRRFLNAQDEVYQMVLKELEMELKRIQWMWYIFPQLKHLGYSYNATSYDVYGFEEAIACLEHPIFGVHMRKTLETILNFPGNMLDKYFDR